VLGKIEEREKEGSGREGKSASEKSEKREGEEGLVSNRRGL